LFMPISEERHNESASAMLSGRSIIGFGSGKASGALFHAFDPQTGHPCEPPFASANAEDVERAVELAAAAAPRWRTAPGTTRAQFLRSVASRLETIAEALIERAHLETALPVTRLQSELARTCHQFRLFASLAEEGSWVMARIDREDPSRTPTAKPDIRSMLRPLGPVVVFGASNFPIAFSVAGGDSVSAWASGNPVIVKAHAAHPGTSELVGHVISESVRSCGLPEGLFSLLFDAGTGAGQALVKHPLVKAVGFTGSHAGGRALMDLAASRSEPIPVFAEMGSLNPVFIFPRALETPGEQILSGLYGSFTLGGGQFCTKPGLIFLSRSPASDHLMRSLEDLVSAAAPFCLLTAGIRNTFVRVREDRRLSSSLQAVIADEMGTGDDSFRVGAMLMETDVTTFLSRPELSEEVFGPAMLLVKHSDKAQLLEVASKLKGHLTATLHGTEKDFEEFAEVIHVLETKVGRLIFNGYPTGVEVCHAIVHGGPYPATSDGRSTSVGTQAVLRFSRPVCFQNCPDELLPAELKNRNPLGIWRVVDGLMTRGALA
jgi:2,5-dioxopentanoate dehydrogenase